MIGEIWNLATSGIVWGFIGGLIVGWNFIPQPGFIAKWFKK